LVSGPVLTGWGKLAPNGNQSPDHPARSESLSTFVEVQDFCKGFVGLKVTTAKKLFKERE